MNYRAILEKNNINYTGRIYLCSLDSIGVSFFLENWGSPYITVMCVNKRILAILILCILPAPLLADLVEEKEVSKWGYTTIEHRLSNRETHIAEIQTIKSIKQASGLKNHYFHYVLSQECYPSYWEAIKRKMSLLYTGEKDYILSELSGKCVRTSDTAAKFATFKEQPRIFMLFNKYLNKTTYNKSTQPTPKNGAAGFKRYTP